MKDTGSVTTLIEAREELEKWRAKVRRKSAAEARARLFVAHYERQVERLQLEQLPREPRGVGDVVRFEKKYTPQGTVYRFAAIRTGGTWWVTGPRSPQGVGWADLIAFVKENNVLLQQPILLDDADNNIQPPF